MRKRHVETAIMIAITLALIGILEAGARIYETVHPRPMVELQLTLQPYLGFAGVKASRGARWYDVVHKRYIDSTMSFNNYGFPERFDYQIAPDAAYLREYGKHPGEKIVLITGGSVVQSAGAIDDDHTISARLERHLREKSGDGHWRVINMAVGSWIAYQEFVALSLFGAPFDADWIVVMDGHNDGVVPCMHGSGLASPMEWPKLLYLTHGGSGQAPSTLTQIGRYSALVRLLAGTRAENGERNDPREVTFDDTEPDQRFRIKLAGVTAAVQDAQVSFYLQSQRNIMNLFGRANVLFSTQPLLWDNAITPAYRTAFGAEGHGMATLEADLDAYMAKHRNARCDRAREVVPSELLGYFMARSALRLSEFAAEAQQHDPSRHILYRNVEAALPYEQEVREDFFIDNAHFTGEGLNRVAEFFAEQILAAERGLTVDVAAFARQRAERRFEPQR